MATSGTSAGVSIAAERWKRATTCRRGSFSTSPYPTNLPVVPACQACNGGFSLDEEYLACVLECVLAGSAYAEAFERPKIAKVLKRKPNLAALIEQRRQQDGERAVFGVDTGRVRNVILKLARGHMSFEMNEPQLGEPEHLVFLPLISMSEEDFATFEASPSEPLALWPEVGSRALQRLVSGEDMGEGGWITVQDGLYRYAVTATAAGYVVRIVLREYLACEVLWS